jgi:hypothetical protein
MDRFFTTTAKCVEVYCSRPGPAEGTLLGYVIRFAGAWEGYRAEGDGLVRVATNEAYAVALARVAGEPEDPCRREPAWEVGG